MNKKAQKKRKAPKKVLDATGIELTPGKPGICLGNGEKGFECCCDECEWYLLCFPEFAKEEEESPSDFQR